MAYRAASLIVMPGGFHVGPQLLARHVTIQPGIRPGVGVERRVLVHDVDDRQVVTLADLVVVGVVAGRDLQRARAEFAIHVLIGDDRDAAG